MSRSNQQKASQHLLVTTSLLSAMLALVLTRTTALPAVSHGGIIPLLPTAVFLLTISHSSTYSILTVETTVVLPMASWIVSLSLLLVSLHY